MTITIEETSDIAICQDLRRRVFIDEQGVCLADEVDGRDGEAVHLVARRDGLPIGTARLLTEGEIGKIGRVCVLKEARGQGIGAALVRAGVEVFRGRSAVVKVKLGAQTHALGFYEGLGFQAVAEVYQDAGMPHRDMILNLYSILHST